MEKKERGSRPKFPYFGDRNYRGGFGVPLQMSENMFGSLGGKEIYREIVTTFCSQDFDSLSGISIYLGDLKSITPQVSKFYFSRS